MSLFVIADTERFVQAPLPMLNQRPVVPHVLADLRYRMVLARRSQESWKFANKSEGHAIPYDLESENASAQRGSQVQVFSVGMKRSHDAATSGVQAPTR